MSISQDLKIYVRSAKTSKEAWDSLANHFEEKTLSKKIMYRRQLYALRKENDETTMTEHINKLKTISEHLEALDDAVLEKDLVMILISSLPEDYNNLITTLETLPEEKLTWDYVRDRVITEFERKNEQKSKSKGPEDALFTKGGYRKNSNFSNRNMNRNEGKDEKDKKFPCHYCQETGHYIKDCPKKKKDLENKENEDQDANFCNGGCSNKEESENDFCPEFVLALHVEECEEKEKQWLLDSGCSKHLTGEKDDLVDYKEFEENDKAQYVTLADKSVVKAQGKGKLNLYLKDERGKKVPVTFHDVLYVPSMTRLISIGQLTLRGAEVSFKKNSVELKISGRKFVIGSRIGKLFKMNYCNFAAVRFERQENLNKIKEVPSEVEEVQEVRIPSEIEVSEENTQKIEEEENLSQIDLMNLSVVEISEENTYKIEEENLSVKLSKNEVEKINEVVTEIMNEVDLILSEDKCEENLVTAEENRKENPSKEVIEVSGSDSTEVKSPVGVLDFKWEKVVKEHKKVKSSKCGLRKVGAVVGAVGQCEICHSAFGGLRDVHPNAVDTGVVCHGTNDDQYVMREIQCSAFNGAVRYVATILDSAIRRYVVCVCSVGSVNHICGNPSMQRMQFFLCGGCVVQPMQFFLCGGCEMQPMQFFQCACVRCATPMNRVHVLLAVVIPTSGSVRNIISVMNVGIPTIPRCLVRELLTLKCLSLSGPVMAFDVIIVIRKPDFSNLECRHFGAL